jgi:hypothetical protein
VIHRLEALPLERDLERLDDVQRLVELLVGGAFERAPQASDE